MVEQLELDSGEQKVVRLAVMKVFDLAEPSAVSSDNQKVVPTDVLSVAQMAVSSVLGMAELSADQMVLTLVVSRAARKVVLWAEQKAGWKEQILVATTADQRAGKKAKQRVC